MKVQNLNENEGCNTVFLTKKKLLSPHYKKFIPQCHSFRINRRS